REEERLLQRLLALRQGVAAAQSPQTLSPQQSLPLLGASEHKKHPVLDAVVRELASAGRPLHISDLMRLLREAQVQIPGAGTQANLITHLRRDPRLVRPSRGMYGLAAWGLENMPRAKQRKRRKRRVRSAANKQRTGP